MLILFLASIIWLGPAPLRMKVGHEKRKEGKKEQSTEEYCRK